MTLNENYGPKIKPKLIAMVAPRLGVYICTYICVCVLAFVWLSLCAWGMWREIVRAAGTQDMDEK